ncbi:MAG: Uma2 family endonuclease [Thermosynechococcaceae cyanobacterium]
MIQAKPRFLSFEDYLDYDDGTEHLYELFNGELIEVPPESGQNVQIANRLFLQFAGLLGSDRIRGHGLELEVWGEPKNRYPDLTVLRPEHVTQLQQRNTIRLSMAPPLLVAEVVSPGELQRERDYTAKRQQYEALAVPEYWIIDPILETVTILELRNQIYTQHQILQNDHPLQSPLFQNLDLTVEQLLYG